MHLETLETSESEKIIFNVQTYFSVTAQQWS